MNVIEKQLLINKFAELYNKLNMYSSRQIKPVAKKYLLEDLEGLTQYIKRLPDEKIMDSLNPLVVSQ